MPWVQDMMGRIVDVPPYPRRILSLVPSQTELLFDLGLGDRIAGVTKFCIHPRHARKSARVVGGTKQIHRDRVDALDPDLIIGNKEENERAIIEELAARYPVWMSDILTLSDALAMIEALGKLTDRSDSARQLIQGIVQAFEPLQTERIVRPRIAYLIWKEPWMGVGRDTFIHDLIEKAGFFNVLEERSRYPLLELATLRELQPEHILLSSEPYPFRPHHGEEIRRLLPECQVHLVDGESFSWYGSRLIPAGKYLADLSEKLCALSGKSSPAEGTRP